MFVEAFSTIINFFFRFVATRRELTQDYLRFGHLWWCSFSFIGFPFKHKQNKWIRWSSHLSSPASLSTTSSDSAGNHNVPVNYRNVLFPTFYRLPALLLLLRPHRNCLEKWKCCCCWKCSCYRGESFLSRSHETGNIMLFTSSYLWVSCWNNQRMHILKSNHFTRRSIQKRCLKHQTTDERVWREFRLEI